MTARDRRSTPARRPCGTPSGRTRSRAPPKTRLVDAADPRPEKSCKNFFCKKRNRPLESSPRFITRRRARTAMPGTRDFFRLAVVAARRTGHEPASHGARARSLGCSASRNPARHLTPIGGSGNRGFATGARDDVDDANDELNAVFGVTVGCDSRSAADARDIKPNGTEGGPETSPNASPSHSVGQRISTNSLSHVDASGAASMVDVGGKAETTRTARASATVR